MAKRSRESKQRAQRRRSQELAQAAGSSNKTTKNILKAPALSKEVAGLSAHLSLKHLAQDLIKTGVVTLVIIAFMIGIYVAL